MRRSLLALIASSVLVVACSEQPTAPTEQRVNPAGPALVVGDPACSEPTAPCIQTLIVELFPKGDLLKSANGFWSNIQTKVRQQRLLEAQARATDLVNFGLKNFYANKLIGGKTQPTVDNLVALADAVYGFTLLTNAPTIPPEALQADAAAVILGPQSPTTLVITETKQAGVIVPAGAAGTPTLVSINRLPDSPGPLLTSLNQFPLFYQFTTTPEITFNQDVTTGVCQSQDFEPYGALRLAHNVEDVGDDGSFGDIEILPRVAAPFLDCSNAAGPIGALDHRGLTGLASAGWSLLGRTVGPVAKAIFLPDDLHAAALGTCCLGGTGKKFSPHGAVDPTSNPGSLGIVDENGDSRDEIEDPSSEDVTGPGTVYVKAASQNGTPIQNVPVTFGETNGETTVETTVLTNGSGIASFLWDATPGTTLTATVPNQSSEDIEQDCPEGIPESPPNSAYRPLVCFTPSSVTFTAPATGVTPVSSSLELIASSNAEGVLVEDTDAASQGATLDQISATVSALAENEAMSVLTKGSAVATWQSGGAGQVVFTDIGWTVADANSENASHAVMYDGTGWTYTFTANESGTFSLDYDVTLDPATTDDFGLQGFSFWWGEGSGELQPEPLMCVVFDPTFCAAPGPGTLTKSVVAGTTYTVRLQIPSNIFFGPAGSITAYMSGTFNWSVTPAPIILLRQSVRSPSGVVAPLAATQLQCKGTQRRVCTRTYQGRQP